MVIRAMFLALTVFQSMSSGFAQNPTPTFEYRLLATSKTSTMQKEMNGAAREGFHLESIRRGLAKSESEVIVVMSRDKNAISNDRYEYKLLAAKRTSTLQKELQEASDAGFEYRDQTSFEGPFSGHEVVVILERDREAPQKQYEYKVLATARTSTMQKELQESGSEGFEFVGMTVANTSWTGDELISILRRELLKLSHQRD